MISQPFNANRGPQSWVQRFRALLLLFFVVVAVKIVNRSGSDLSGKGSEVIMLVDDYHHHYNNNTTTTKNNNNINSNDLPLCSKPGEHLKGQWVLREGGGDRASIDPWPCCGDFDVNHSTEPACSKEEPLSRYLKLMRGSKEQWALMGGHACMGNCGPTGKYAVADWVPSTCRLMQWDAIAFCKTLGSRQLLVLGDSTMLQTAATLMNAVHHVCPEQITHYYCDTMDGKNYGGYNRGGPWYEIVERLKPDIVLLSVGMHIMEMDDFYRVVKEVATEYKARKTNNTHATATRPQQQQTANFNFNSTTMIWKTQSPCGCGDEILTDLPTKVDPNYWNNQDRGGPYAKKFKWHTYEQRDEFVSKFFADEHIPVLDVRPLHMRVDAHPGHLPRGALDCGHFCGHGLGPLSLIPVLLHHLLLSVLPDVNSLSLERAVEGGMIT